MDKFLDARGKVIEEGVNVVWASRAGSNVWMGVGNVSRMEYDKNMKGETALVKIVVRREKDQRRIHLYNVVDVLRIDN